MPFLPAVSLQSLATYERVTYGDGRSRGGDDEKSHDVRPASVLACFGTADAASVSEAIEVAARQRCKEVRSTVETQGGDDRCIGRLLQRGCSF